MTSDHQPTSGLTIVRTLKASKEAVFHALSDAEALGQWWGPAGSAITVVNFDFQPGGHFHYKLEAAGQVMWGRFVYQSIDRPDRIEFISSFADEGGQISKSPFPMDFPLEVFNRITLADAEGGTELTLAGHPVNATPEQEATYQSIIPGMEQGFGGTLTQLEAYLERVA